eukprot:scaffold1559_cov193-Alexandrium_tamarense.AAC.13
MSSHGDLLYVLWNRIEARKHGRRDRFEPTGACTQKALGARVRETERTIFGTYLYPKVDI